jgi:hypothetical protein
VLVSFGGGRVITGVTSTPFKCPPAPSETALPHGVGDDNWLKFAGCVAREENSPRYRNCLIT